MERIPITSSNIASIGYDSAKMILEIEFQVGGIYQYYNVPQSVFEDMKNSSSKGAYFDREIKNTGYQYQRLSSQDFMAFEFHSYIIKMMKQNPDFKDIQPECRLKIGDPPVLVDVACDYKGKRTLVEIKQTPPFTKDRLLTYIAQLHQYLKVEPHAALVLLFSGSVPEDYYNIATERRIDIWDSEKLRQIFCNQLGILENTPLYHLFYLAPNKSTSSSQTARFISELGNILPGRDDCYKYQRKCKDIFEYLFSPPLGKPHYENRDETNTNRRDIIFPNYAESGFWEFLRNKYAADYILIDAKNYTDDIKKDAVLQMSNYLKSFGAGLFGIILSRNQPSNGALITRREHWIAYKKLIVFLDDVDIKQMLKTKEDNIVLAEEVIKEKIEQFRLKL